MALSIAQVGTYYPTQCGIASFTQSMLVHLRSEGARVGVVRIVADDEAALRPRFPSAFDPEVVHEWTSSSGSSAAAEAINSHDAVVIQHEFGIFPGDDGVEVLALVDDVRIPVVTVLHTVVAHPTDRQKFILESLCARSDAVVVMTHAARTRLIAHYDVDVSRLRTIPHGAVDNRQRQPRLVVRPTILTWGLLGPGKGIEWGIRALAELVDIDPQPQYSVVGQTHPKVLDRDGPAYQNAMAALSDDLGLADVVSFDHRYLEGPALRQVVQAADVVLLPYDSSEQVTSGVLIEAVAAGKPVVATRFPHAEELLATGAGLTVPQGDWHAMAAALRRILTEPGLARGMSAEASRIAPSLLWPTVAQRYLATVNDVLRVAARTAS